MTNRNYTGPYSGDQMDPREALRRISSDRTSGAAEILRRAAEVFSLLPTHPAPTIEDARRLVAETCASLARAQPYMAPIANLATRVKSEAAMASEPGELFERASRAAREFVEQAAAAAARAAELAAEELKDHAVVLTHSRSSTVLDAILRAFRAGRQLDVIVTESRPLFEGRTVAETLAGEGIPVTLIADAAASLMMERAGLVLVGADSVTSRFLVNKIGTRMIALSAREAGVPCYAVSDSSKFVNERVAGFAEALRDPKELWADAPAGVRVVNPYFERIPIGRFSGVITEDGLLTPGQLAQSRLAT